MLQSPFSVPTCNYCNKPLKEGQSDICDDLTCLSRQRTEQAQAAHKARREKFDAGEKVRWARVGGILKETAARAGGTLDEVAHGVVPHTSSHNVPLPAERRVAFEAHLDQMIARGFGPEGDALLASADKSFEDRDYLDKDEGKVLDLSCIACRGYCCQQAAGNHAFIGVKTIAYYRHRNPDTTPEEARAAYLSYMPELSMYDGCVYQGEMGCTMPREMRADVCNDYQCVYRVQFYRELEKKGETRAAIVALSRDHEAPTVPNTRLLSAATIDSEGTLEIHDDFELPPLTDTAD